MVTKLDLRKQLKHLYEPPAKKVVEVDVPTMTFLMLDGQGDPNTAASYQQAIEALYGLAYTLKFACKKTLGLDYPVMPLEGLWWMDDMGGRFGDIDFAADKSRWKWTMMVMLPDEVPADAVETARQELGAKKDLPALADVRVERFEEGLAAQIMHLGSYAEEKPTIEKVHRFIEEAGCEPRGKHHEVYIGDPRRSAPEKLRTVVRQPMARKA
jgi:hypothetical protein